MSRPDLPDLIYEAGGLQLLDTPAAQAAIAEHRVGPGTVLHVLLHRALYADSAGLSRWGQRRIAERTGIHYRNVRKADEVLVAAGLLVVIDASSRPTRFAVVPDLITADTSRQETPDDDESMRTAHTSPDTDARAFARGDARGDARGSTRRRGVEKRSPLTPRERGTNPRAKGTNERAAGTNPRATATNPRATGTNPRAVTKHEHEENVRRAVTNNPDMLRILHMTPDDFVALCYDFAGPHGDPWYDGYLPIKTDMDTMGTGVRNPVAVLRHRRSA